MADLKPEEGDMGGAYEMHKDTFAPDRAQKQLVLHARSDFYNDSRWADNGKEDYDLRNYDNYFLSLDDNGRERFKKELGLARAVRDKRDAEKPEEFGSENKSLKGISKEEMRMFYEEIPGVKNGLEFHLRLVDLARNQDYRGKLGVRQGANGFPETFSVLECKTREEVNQFRMTVENKIFEELRNGGHLTEEEARFQARRAEIVSFNIHYCGNLYEAKDSVWEGDTRKRTPTIGAGELANSSLKSLMRPMDSLIDRVLSKESKQKPVGVFYGWARNHVLKFIGGMPAYDKFDEIQLTYDPQQFWRSESYFENGTEKHRAYAPECYTKGLVNSVWDETSIGDKKLIDYLRSGEQIPWNQVPEKMWENYLTKIDAASVIWKIYQGDKDFIISGAMFDRDGNGRAKLHQGWVAPVLKKFADLELRDLRKKENWILFRWLIHASTGIREETQAPTMAAGRVDKLLIKDAFTRILSSQGADKKWFLFPWE